ncbi:TonB-dependent receptor [Xylophilus sp. GW821-FHT01B05]
MTFSPCPPPSQRAAMVRRPTGVWAALACALVLAQPDHAAAQPDEPDALEAVTVTARRRAESAQEVPISIKAIQGADLATQASPVVGNAGLARATPNLSFVDGVGLNSNVFNLRGVGSLAPLSPDDTSVVMYMNDAPRSVYGAAPVLMDIDRVEVLRGPQGTLLGRNTQGGAINVIPNLPTFKRGFSATTEVGSHGYRLGEIVANGPLSEQLAGRLAVRYSNLDGNIPNVALGGKDGRVQIGALRGSLLWTPGNDTTVSFVGFYDKQQSSAPNFIWKQDPQFPRSAVNPRREVRSRDAGASLKVEHGFERFKLTSLTSYEDSRSFQPMDMTDGLIYSALTGRPQSLFDVPYADYAAINFRDKTWQQELRLSSVEGSALAWTAGVNYFHSSFGNDTTSQASAAAFNFATQNGAFTNRIRSGSASVFGEATLPLTQALKATLGLRHTRESKDASYQFVGNGSAAVVPYWLQQSRLVDSFTTGRAGLSYDWTPALMTYATVSRGAVAAGYPATSVNSPTGKQESPFPTSTSWTYELGFKSQWLDRRATLNGALFHNDVKNGHLIVFNPSALLFTPAALDYRSSGAELEAEAQITRAFKLTGGAGYTHAELVDVPTGSATGALSGNRVPNVPRWTASLGGQFEAPAQALGLPGRIKAALAWQYVGARAVDVRESFMLPGYGVLNARLGWQHGNWEFYGFAWNLRNKQYAVAGQAWGPGVSSVRVGQGRIAGLGATLRF